MRVQENHAAPERVTLGLDAPSPLEMKSMQEVRVKAMLVSVALISTMSSFISATSVFVTQGSNDRDCAHRTPAKKEKLGRCRPTKSNLPMPFQVLRTASTG